MRRKIFVVWTFSFLFLIFVFAVAYGYGSTIETSVEDTLLKGDWERVFEVLEKDEEKADDPVARLIMGHACLVMNRNNASMLLFLSVKEEKDLKLWSEWTESLVYRNPKNPIAHYLSADAKARQGRLEEAKEEFTQALQIKGDFTLAYNARGVVRVLINDWDNALVDLLASTRLGPDLADAYANLGTYWILKEGPEGALEAFNQAIDINPEFALAYNGRGCAYFGQAEFEKASQDFTIASQLSPVLGVTEVNQGFTSIFASSLVALGSVEKRPGTTLEFRQQHQEILNKQNQELLRILPSQKDQEFWKMINTPSSLLSNPEKLQSLVKEHGVQKVQMGIFIEMNGANQKIFENSQTIQKELPKIESYNKKINNLYLTEKIISFANAARSIINTVNKPSLTIPEAAGYGGLDIKGKESFERIIPETAVTIGKAGAGALVPRGWDLFLKAVPTSIDPISAAAGAGRVLLDLERWENEIGRQNTLTKIIFLEAENRISAVNVQLYNRLINNLSSSHSSNSLKSAPSQIPGYFTSIDRPLTEVGTLASMVDKGIKSAGGSTRSALIVSQDPFRANLLQSELNKYGFQTKVIPPGTDPQTAARQWGADVILGIKGETKLPQMERTTFTSLTPSKQYYDDNWKKFPPPFPPDKGGGAAGIPQKSQSSIQQQQQQNWDWGKPFIPTYPKGSPGGISTEELARSFVDKGNWPVMTSFSLFYIVGPSTGSQNEEKK